MNHGPSFITPITIWFNEKKIKSDCMKHTWIDFERKNETIENILMVCMIHNFKKWNKIHQFGWQCSKFIQAHVTRLKVVGLLCFVCVWLLLGGKWFMDNDMWRHLRDGMTHHTTYQTPLYHSTLHTNHSISNMSRL